MPGWKPIVGTAFDPAQFEAYCKTLSWPSWRPGFIVVHNTAIPNLAQRPDGFTRRHIDNLVGYYRDRKGWSAGPHLFVDDRQIWVFTPLTTTGRHSPTWNALSIGIEMLGDYAVEAFNTGRGKAVRENTVRAIASLSRAIGLDPAALRLHKEDPVTTHTSCPGKNVSKASLIAQVRQVMAVRYGQDHGHGHPD